MANDGIGDRVLRKEDKRFLTGRGRYTDDINVTGVQHAVFVRSPHAHAKIKSIDATEAKAAPGVAGVLTGAELAEDKIGNIICGWMIHSKDGSPMKAGAHPALAKDVVRYVGDAVAVVIAATRNQARDAAERVVVDYEELPAIVDPAKARDTGAPQIHPEAPSNTVFNGPSETRRRPTRHSPRQPRSSNSTDQQPRHCRTRSSRARHWRSTIPPKSTSRFTRLAEPAHGSAGAIGVRRHCARAQAARGRARRWRRFRFEDLHLSRRGGLPAGPPSESAGPVKWTADRSNRSWPTPMAGIMSAMPRWLSIQNNKILGFRSRRSPISAPTSRPSGRSIPTYLYGPLLSGQYDIPAVYCEVDAVYTNTTPVDAVRGAGRPEAAFVVERMMETAARKLGEDPVELRRKNFVRTFPAPDADRHGLRLRRLRSVAQRGTKGRRLHDFQARKEEAAQRGKLRGIGVSCYIEACGLAPSRAVGSVGAGVGLWESAEVRVNPVGTIEVLTGNHSHGQGHETTFAQVVNDRLGIGLDKIQIVHGDTDKVQFGMGTSGSRTVVGMSAIVGALDKVEAKAKKIAAHLLEAAEADIVIENGELKVAGTDKKKTFRKSRWPPTPRTISRLAWNRTQGGRPSTIRPTSLSRRDAYLPRSRSIRRPAKSTSCSSSPPTTSVRSSIR